MRKLFFLLLLSFSTFSLSSQNDPLRVFSAKWAADSCGCSEWRAKQVTYDAISGTTLIAGLTFLDMDYGAINSIFGKPQIFQKVNESTFVYCYTLYDYDQCGDVSKGWENIRFTFTDGIVSNIDVIYLVHEYGGTATIQYCNSKAS